MITNLSEAINKLLKGARNLPITVLARCTYNRCMEYFIQCGEKAKSRLYHSVRSSAKLLEAISKNEEHASLYRMERYDIETSRFEIKEPYNPVTQRGGKKWVVDLARQHCHCEKFKAYIYSCSHVIAACSRYSLDFWQYVNRVYTLKYIANAYSG